MCADVMEALLKVADKYNPFLLASGERSPFFIDASDLWQHPQLAQNCIAALADFIPLSKDVAVAGVPLGGTLLSVAVYTHLLHQQRPVDLMTVRKQAKGPAGRIEYTGSAQTVILLEDVVTTGSSVLECVAAIKKEYHPDVAVEVVVLVDRQQGGVQRLRTAGLKVYVVHEVMTFLPPHLQQYINDHQYEHFDVKKDTALVNAGLNAL